LPLFLPLATLRRRPRTRSPRPSRRRSAAPYDAALLDIQSALGEAVARLKAARQADALVARKALPEARAALKSILTDYAQGRGDLAAALAAQHQAHDLELKLLQLELDEQTAIAAIERLIGGEL
jgi:cobalt-zinc-cadmium efflux system outer membrane protein